MRMLHAYRRTRVDVWRVQLLELNADRVFKNGANLIASCCTRNPTALQTAAAQKPYT